MFEKQIDTIADHDRLYKLASKAVFPLIQVDNRPNVRLTDADRNSLRTGIALFERVLAIRHDNWSAMWLIGKAYQRLDDVGQSLEWFSRAHEVNPTQPDVAREAAIAAMQLSRPLDAVRFCERAIGSKPTDAGLRANLSLALLFSGDVARATATAQDALARMPSDAITQRIVNVCKEVEAGKRPCPHHVRDLSA